MDRNNKDHDMDSEQIGKEYEKGKREPQFNAGGNESDYDGGHPRDSLPDEGLDSKSGTAADDKSEGRGFNEGGNDSDYDGGHPGDSSKGRSGSIRDKD